MSRLEREKKKNEMQKRRSKKRDKTDEGGDVKEKEGGTIDCICLYQLDVWKATSWGGRPNDE